MEVVLGIPFLFFYNTDVKFAKLVKLIWIIYIASEALPITSQIKLIDKREFAKTAHNVSSETFVIYIAAQGVEIAINPLQTA